MGRRTNDGRASGATNKGDDNDTMVYAEFIGATLIHGVSLKRYWLDRRRSDLYKDAKTYWFWVYEPSPFMVDIQCDNCVRRHNPTNLNCSATWDRPTGFTNPGELYAFKSQAPFSDTFAESVVAEGASIRGVLVTFDNDVVL
jgi:hypothetical protein